MLVSYKPLKRDLERISSRLFKRAGISAACVLAVWIGVDAAEAQLITTFAGSGVAGFSGDNVPATSAALNSPRGVAFDAQGNIYVADRFNHRVRRISAAGMISTVAGTGTAGFSGDGGPATSAQLNQPEDVWVDAGGTLYIADSSNHRIRRVSTGGTIITVAGTGTDSYNGDGGAATSAHLNRPTSVVVDGSGNIYVADSSNHRIRRIALNGSISTVAGNGVQAYSGEGVQATSAALRFPVGLAMDSSGNLYIADAGNHVVRRVTPAGIINTVAGNGTGAGTDTGSFSGDGGAATSAGLNTAEDVAVDSTGTLFIADSANYRVRRVSGGAINTIAGTGSDGFAGDGGAATGAMLNFPWAVSLDTSGNLYVGDMFNQRVRRIAGAGAGVATPGIGPGPASSGPTISSGGVVDGAGFRGTLSAGAIVSIFGQDLAGSTQNATGLPLPNAMGGTSVSVNGTAAPLFYVSPTQLNVQLPFNVSGGATVQVTRDGVAGPSQGISISSFSPAIFTVPSGGSGPGAILHNNSGVLISASAPAARGEFIAIFCTGLGPVQPPVPSGTPGPSNPLSQTTTTPTVTIGGIPAVVNFAGLAPTFAGLYQINAQVPQGVAPGNAVPVVVSIGGVVSNTVTIAVQ
jgi:uncharacterized protein (TIGR03437 family)